jgi:hypothetical protein
VLLALSFRLIAIPIAILLVIVQQKRLFEFGYRQRLLLVVFVLVLLSPVDIALPGTGELIGQKRNGVRLVAVVHSLATRK